jgi:hypothetical protein
MDSEALIQHSKVGRAFHHDQRLVQGPNLRGMSAGSACSKNRQPARNQDLPFPNPAEFKH